MAALFKWKEPRSVAHWEFKNEFIPEFKNLLFLFGKWGLIFGLPFFYAMWRWLPEEFVSIFHRAWIVTFALPVSLIALVWVCSKFVASYTVDKKGIFRVVGNSGRFLKWNEIEAFHFEDYPNVPDVRSLVLDVRKGKRQHKHHFTFSPHEVSERELDELLRQHLSKT